VGALGSNLIPILYQLGFNNVRFLDDDKIESHNLGNQNFERRFIGKNKAAVMQAMIYQAYRVKPVIETCRLVEKNALKILRGNRLVVDAFDNWDSRQLIHDTCGNGVVPCLHGGMAAQGYSEVYWNPRFKRPAVEEDGLDVCEYPLARNLVHFTVGMMAEAICRFIDNDEYLGYMFTLKDMKMTAYNLFS